jgi:hypothetical protein
VTEDKEPFGSWLFRSLIRFGIVGVLVVYAFAAADWDSDTSAAGNLVVDPAVALGFWGVPLILLLSLSVPLYLGVLALFNSPRRLRLIPLAMSPLVGVPWWLWAWIDYDDDPGFIVFLVALCLAFGLAVPLRRSRDSIEFARRFAPPASGGARPGPQTGQS